MDQNQWRINSQTSYNKEIICEDIEFTEVSQEKHQLLIHAMAERMARIRKQRDDDGMAPSE